MENDGGNRIGHIVSAIINIVLLLVMNRLPDWNLSFLLPTYQNTLWAINLSLGVQIGLYVVLSFYHPALLYSLTQVASAIVNIIALAVFLGIFPIDFTSLVGTWLNTLIRIGLAIGLGGSAVSLVVNGVKATKAATALGKERR